MTTTRRRRWLLAAVAIVVVAAVVGFVIIREDPKDVPRLVFLRQEQQNGEQRVVFRFDAPKRRCAILSTIATVDLATGVERGPRVVSVYVSSEKESPAETGFRPDRPVMATAGQSVPFWVPPPPDEVWRLRCSVWVGHRSLSDVTARVKWCWQRKSLTPMWRVAWCAWGSIESEPFSNAIPATPDARHR